MVESFINEYIAGLHGRIPDEYLIIVRNALQCSLDRYDMTPKEKSVVPYADPCPECLKVFLVTKKIEGRSQKTLDLYKLYLTDMFSAMQVPVEKITSNNIKVYLYGLQKTRNISSRTLDSRRSAMSSFFSWAAAEQYIGRNPMTNIGPIAYERSERKPLNDTELELVREACADVRERAMIEFLYSTGCRVTEMERMNRDDVDFAKMEVSLFGKGDKHRKSYLTPKAKLMLEKYLSARTDDNEALFVYKRSPYGRIKKSGIEKIVREIGIRAGVDRLHPHLIRHTTATNALQHGMDVTQVQALLGHENLNTTMIYAKVDGYDVQRNHRKCIS